MMRLNKRRYYSLLKKQKRPAPLLYLMKSMAMLYALLPLVMFLKNSAVAHMFITQQKSAVLPLNLKKASLQVFAVFKQEQA